MEFRTKTFIMKINNDIPKIIKKTAVWIFWIAVWQIIYMLVGRDLLLASPISTFKALIELCTDNMFYRTVALSFVRIALGFLIGSAVGILLGAATGFSKTLYMLFKPMIDIIRAAPVASFIILALAWMKTGTVPVFISFLMVVPIMWSNITEGIASVDFKLLEMAHMYEYSPMVQLKKIYIPAVLPYIRSATATGVGFAWKSGVAAEVIGTPKYSVGSRLYESKIYLETPQLFAWTAVVIILSVLFEKVIISAVAGKTKR